MIARREANSHICFANVGHPTDPELRLLLACSRARAAELDRSAIAAALAGVRDWQRVVAAADWHGITPLLAFHLLAEYWDAVPAAVRAELDLRFKGSARQALVLTNDLLRTLDILASHGVQAIPYKGAALAALLYGNLVLREFSDTDLLVRPEQARIAYEALLAAGFLPETKFTDAHLRHHLATGCEFNFRVPWGESRVEIHWRIVPSHYGVEFDMGEMFGRLTSASVAERSVPALLPEDLLAVLCVHGGKHGWERLAWVCDIHELVRACPELDWELAHDEACRAGAERYLLLGCRLAQRLLGTRIPENLAARIQQESQVERMAARLAAGLLAQSDQDRTNWARWRFLLDLKKRRRDKLRCMWRYATIPDSMDWESVPLPDRLHAAYPAVRVARLALSLGRVRTPKIFRERSAEVTSG